MFNERSLDLAFEAVHDHLVIKPNYMDVARNTGSAILNYEISARMITVMLDVCHNLRELGIVVNIKGNIYGSTCRYGSKDGAHRIENAPKP